MKNLIIYTSVIVICICGQLFSQQGSIKINSLEGSAIKGDAGKMFIIQIDIGSPDLVIGLTGLSFKLNWNSKDYIETLNSSKGSFFGNDQLFLYRNYPDRLEAGVTSTTGPYSGSGIAVACTMKVKQKVSGTVKVTFDLTDISALDAQGRSVQLTPFNNSFVLKLCDELPLELLSPNGGEFLKVETTKEITWSSKEIDSLRIEYSTNNGKDWQIIERSIPASTGKYLWTVPDKPSEECLIKISSTSDAGQVDISSKPFVIYPSRQVFGPYLPDEYTLALLHFDGDLKNRSALTSNANANGGGIAFSNDSPLGSGQSVSINNKDYCGSSVSIPNASSLDLQGDFTIEFWAKIRSAGSGCVTWSALISKPADNSSLAPCYQIGLWDSGIQAFGQIFNGSIGPRVFSNNGSFSMGSWYHFALIRDIKNNKLRLLIHDSNRNLVDQTEALNMPSNVFPMKSLRDLLIGSPFDGYIDELRISSTVRDFSPAALSLISPNGYELLFPLSTHRIQWTSQNVGKVKLEFSANNGNTWSLIAASVDASASFYNWIVPNVISDSCRIRITDLANPGVCEQSLYKFSIKKPSIHLT
ncbi:MAG: LamG-like jellyroll fold domain-containing protein, partial [Clostridiales bacterium]